MADDGQERSEQPTPKRRREAAEKGQVVRSRELTAFAMLLAGAGGLLALGPWLLDGLLAQMRRGMSQDPKRMADADALAAALAGALADTLLMLAPFLALMVAVALLAPLALGGWNLSAKALGFKWERISPLKGLKRLFSLRALMELLKALAKFAVVAAVAVAVLWIREPRLLHLGLEPLPPALARAAAELGWIFLLLVLPMLLVAAVDVPFQLYDHARRLRMTRREVKDEMKDSEGRPEVRSRIRRLQEEFARRRMMDKVPRADVVVTNPDHFAVALRYQPAAMDAPQVVARGVDKVALTIAAVAAAHGVPRVQSPLLARALYFNSRLDRTIPVALYVAVAQVLAYVFQLRREERLPPTPIAMPQVPVPPELRTE
ncbi:MAG: flagellar biosynthesis protein FlhB [Pseudomonadota bacterium]|nr:flagellar biosynthesis protein FlhB [Pseudomonadota bacterium]